MICILFFLYCSIPLCVPLTYAVYWGDEWMGCHTCYTSSVRVHMIWVPKSSPYGLSYCHPLFITKSTGSYPQDTSDINTTKVFEEGKVEEGEVEEGVYSLVRILLGILLRILLRNLLRILLLKFLVKQKGWETQFSLSVCPNLTSVFATQSLMKKLSQKGQAWVFSKSVKTANEQRQLQVNYLPGHPAIF